ncbi:MAG: phage tail protein [Acidimicrobiales bacterium]
MSANPQAMAPTTANRRLPKRPKDWLVGQLPLGMFEDDLLRRFVSIFQTIGDSVLDQADGLGHLLDPAVAPTPMVRFLGQWLGEEALQGDVDDLTARRWVAAGPELSRWRGTARGLTMLLELVTGAPVMVTDSGRVWVQGQDPNPERKPVPVVIRVSRLGALGPADLEALVRRELPAHVAFALYVDRVLLAASTQQPTGPVPERMLPTKRKDPMWPR